MATYYLRAAGGTKNAGDYRGVWTTGGSWAVGDRVYAVNVKSYRIYECTTPGGGDAAEPVWNTTEGLTTPMTAGAVFTTRHPTTWADASNSLVDMLLSMTNADTIWVDPAFADPVTTSKTLTFRPTPGLQLLCADAMTGEPPTGIANTAVVESSGNGALTLNGCADLYGITFRKSGGSGGSVAFNIGTSGSASLNFDACNLEYTNTQGSRNIVFGGSSGAWGKIRIRNGNILLRDKGMGAQNAEVHIENCTSSWTGVAPVHILNCASGRMHISGSDLSGWGYTGGLVNAASTGGIVQIHGCKLFSENYVTGSWPASGNGIRVLLSDCSSGNNHNLLAYYDGQGSIVSDTGVYFTGDAAGQSWRITTNANVVSPTTPFVTPWIPFDQALSGSVTPYFEVLRNNDDTAAYDNDDVWAEFAAKTTTGFPLLSFKHDGLATPITAAAAQAAGAGTGSWTGGSGLRWSGKLDSGSAFTLAESGVILGRVVVGLAGIAGKLHVAPTIRT